MAAFVFFIEMCFGLYIMIKFLILKNSCEQKSMTVFYSLAILDIVTRIIYFIVSCFVDQVNETLITLSTVSTLASVASGISHS